MLSMSRTTSPSASVSGVTTSLRLKARSWRVRSTPRAAAFWTSSALMRSLSAGDILASMISLCPLITVSRLLKSCATPPASRPTASIFCASRSWTSSDRRSVTSVAIPKRPVTSP